MKNLRVAIKIGLIIALLVLTALGILGVGYAQQTEESARLKHIVEGTVRTREEARDLRMDLVSALRYQRLAVLSDDDADSRRFAELAREAARRVDARRGELADLVDRNGSSEDRRNVEAFNRAWDDYKKAQDETLPLAEQNSNTKARDLLHGKMAERLDAAAIALDGIAQQAENDLAQPDAAKELAKVRDLVKRQRQAARVLTLLYQINALLAHHIEASDGVLKELDDQLVDLWRQAGDLARELTASLPERGQADRIGRNLAELKSEAGKVQTLSRQNSENKARQLTLGPVQKATDACAAALGRLVDSLNEQTQRDIAEARESMQSAQRNMFIVALLGMGVSVALAWVLTRSITQPMTEGVLLSEEMAEGNLSRRLNLGQRDEVGRFADSIDRMANSLCGVICNIRRVSQNITGSSADLGGVSHDLLSQSEEMAAQSTQVASSSEQMATNIHTMAAAAEEVSMNVVSISSASEQISANVGTISSAAETTARNVQAVVGRIQEATGAFDVIAKDASEGSQVTARAYRMAQQATGTMSQLDKAAGEINKVTEAIKMIALQTNLLALNATIEATAAGEAGRGFAVVAHEIKELANQSGRAAEDIAAKIEGVQGSTREAVRVIEEMAAIVNSINTSAERISEAVERQTKSAGASVADLGQASRGVEEIAHSIREVAKGATDMSRNAGEAAKGANDVSRNAGEAARAVREVSSNIQGVNQATQENATSAHRVNGAAAKLKEIAQELEKIVGRFKTA